MAAYDPCRFCGVPVRIDVDEEPECDDAFACRRRARAALDARSREVEAAEAAASSKGRVLRQAMSFVITRRNAIRPELGHVHGLPYYGCRGCGVVAESRENLRHLQSCEFVWSQSVIRAFAEVEMPELTPADIAHPSIQPVLEDEPCGPDCPTPELAMARAGVTG